MYLKIVNCIVCFILLLSVNCIAQKSGTELRLVTLKDGSVILGEVIEDTEGYILLEIVGKEQVKLWHKYIKKISKSRPNHYFLDNGKSFKEKGYLNYTKIGNSFGSFQGGFHLHNISAWQFNKRWAAGLGIGLDVHGVNAGNTYSFLPIYLHGRGYPFDFKVSPFYALSLGYGIPVYNPEFWQGFYKGGIMINPSIGLRFASRRRSNFILEMGYIFQNTYGEYTRWQDGAFVKENIRFRRFQLTLGWLF